MILEWACSFQQPVIHKTSRRIGSDFVCFDAILSIDFLSCRPFVPLDCRLTARGIIEPLSGFASRANQSSISPYMEPIESETKR